MRAPRFSLRQLGYFVAVAEAGSIRKAAGRLHVSEAALSQALRELETELGSALLTRRRAHGATLTAAGVDLVGEARAVLQAASDLGAAAQGLAHGLSGRVGIGCYASLAPFLLPPLVGGFRDRYPAVRLELAEGSAGDLQARLRTGSSELALLYEVALDDDIAREPLDRVTPSVVLAAGHRLAGAGSIDLAALQDEPLILYDVAPSTGHTDEVFRRAGVTPRVGQRSANFELVRSLVARGLGYSILLQTPQQPFSYEGRALVTRPLADDTSSIAIVMAWAKGARETPRAGLLRSACRAFCTGLSAPSQGT